ncbi:MAG: transcriptional repressor [Neomegalonema sp.]|nr:transcriptional repressor [Neomegalonema sp.]
MTLNSTSDPAPRAFRSHDHAQCQQAALERAAQICAERGARLTPVRQRVLEILWENHQPLGAYAVLDRLRAENLGSQPPVVYRALDFLIEHGLAHKVVSLNAYVGCAHPAQPHIPHFLICTECQQVAEISSAAISDGINQAAAQRGFRAAATPVEIPGQCASCLAQKD